MTTTPPTPSLKWCQDVTRTHSKTFYRGSLLYPAGQREAIWAVYAACRVGDDITDEQTMPEAERNLQVWWSEIQAAYQGVSGESDMQRALCWAVKQYPVPLSAFAELFEGFRMDLRGTTYHTLDDLTLYCRRVAGVVGFMIAPIGGYRGGEPTLQAALSLGQAMQLTNILRDVGEDLRLGRLYLPRELLDQFGVQESDLRSGQVTPAYMALLQHLTGLAHQWYDEGLTGIPLLQGRARYGVGVAARLYRGILDEVSRNGYDNLNRRAVVSGKRKLWLTVQELDFQMTRSSFCPIDWAERQYARLRAG